MKNNLIVIFFTAGIILGLIADVPQIVRLVRRKSSDDISIPTFVLVWSMAFCYTMVAVLTEASILVLLNYGLSLTAVGLVLALSIYYRIYRGGRQKGATSQGSQPGAESSADERTGQEGVVGKSGE